MLKRIVLNPLWLIAERIGKLVAAVDDLKNAVVRLNTDVGAELDAIAAKLATFGDSVTSADVENAVASINAVSDKLEAETAALGTGTGTGTGT